MIQEKYEELHDELEPLVININDILHGEVWKKADETTLHNKIENIISELLKNDNYKMLTDHSKEEIEELYKKFSNASLPYYPVWASSLKQLEYLLTDLEGEFIVSSGRRRQKEYKLNGSTLEILRFKGSYKDLSLRLPNVDKIIIDNRRTINVQAINSSGEVIAEWDEYNKTTSVALVRVDSNEYDYKWRG
ncbi:hypothetical protein OF864_15450 [Bacillus cereus]|uniref:hypothetical protein n=1 Tax=Bacillus TaxID=1386 RepID=UPI0024B8A2FB|nr:hypothetical protein [Bacillus cereus]WHS73260.1 hypothetical protein OF864_15450 [Bacillus cereus]